MRSSNRLCFFNRMTLKRSKSVSDWRRSCWSCFLAQLPSCHLASIPAASHAFLTAPDRAPRGSFSTTIGVSRVLASETMPRGVARRGSEEGPSTRAWSTSVLVSFPIHMSIDCLIGLGGGSVSTYALVVDDLDDGGEAAALELQHAADLDATPRSRSDVDLCHFIDVLMWSVVLVSGISRSAR